MLGTATVLTVFIQKLLLLYKQNYSFIILVEVLILHSTNSLLQKKVLLLFSIYVKAQKYSKVKHF